MGRLVKNNDWKYLIDLVLMFYKYLYFIKYFSGIVVTLRGILLVDKFENNCVNSFLVMLIF